MSEIAERMRSELAGLDVLDRAELAHFLIATLDGKPDADAEAAWDAELARRADEITSGRATGEPAEKVFRELRAKHS